MTYRNSNGPPGGPRCTEIWKKLRARNWRYVNSSQFSMHPYQYVRPGRHGERKGGKQDEDWFQSEVDLINFVKKNTK